MERNLLPSARSVSRYLQHASHRTIPTAWPTHVGKTLASHRASVRIIHITASKGLQSRPPKTRDRGPKSDEDTQTDFGALDVLRNTAAPATSIDACTSDGFALNNQMRISESGLLLIGGEAFRWRPWLREGSAADWSSGTDSMTGKLTNAKKQWDVHEGVWGVLELVYPKPGKSPCSIYFSSFTLTAR